MYRISRLQSLLKGISRSAFDRLVEQHGSDKHCKGFASWDQLVVMVYAQISGAQSLRQIEAGFNAHDTHHYHLGTQAISRSTLADANGRRDTAVFSALVKGLMAEAGRRLRRGAGELLYLLDSTSITLKGREFDAWASANRTQHTQGLKLHLQYAPDAAHPVWHDFSAANVNDIDAVRDLTFERGARYVFDKGYCDYGWWARIDEAGATFVTRFKRNAGLAVVESRPIDQADAGVILADRLVKFKHYHSRGGKRLRYMKVLREVVVARPDRTDALVLATNDLTSPAGEIAQHYRQRWQIELYFKWIKQHLRIKSFVGRSENAVRTQILTALISYLLVAMYKQTHGIKDSLWMVLSQLRAALFQVPAIDAHRYRIRKAREQFMSEHQPALFT